MRTVQRPDGSEYLSNTRVIYCAIGWIEPERREGVRALLAGMCDSLKAGDPPERAAAGFDGEARAAAIRAGLLIRRFEVVIGKSSHPLVEERVQTADHKDNLGIFAGEVYRSEDASDLADQTARALGKLLLALGAVDLMCMNMD